MTTRYHIWHNSYLSKIENELNGIQDNDKREKLEFTKKASVKCLKSFEDLIAKKAADSYKGSEESRISYIARLSAANEEEFLVGMKRYDLTKASSEHIWKLVAEYQEYCSHTAGISLPEKRDGDYLDTNCRYNYTKNQEACLLLGYQLPWKENIETIARIAEGKRVLELGAGAGLWGRLLNETGVDIICTDNKSWTYVNVFPTYYHVEDIDWVDAVNKYPTDLLLMIWPPPGKSKTLLDALEAFQGDNVILIGEQSELTGGNEIIDYLDIWANNTSRELNNYCNKWPIHYKVYEKKYLEGRLGLFHWKKYNSA